MSATVLTIVEKIKPQPFANTGLENFVTTPCEHLPAQIVLDDPRLSLYCLDDANQQAFFVETPPAVDLSQAPFYYTTQYDQAQRLIALPYAEFHALADTIPTAKLILINSTGRCGSTLISQALNTVDGVLSLSEPDVFTQIHLMRFVDHSRDADYTRLLTSCVRFYGLRTPTLALKFRAMCLWVGDLLYQAFPDAKHLFLYREAEAWSKSMGLTTIPIEVRRAPTPEFPIFRRSMSPLSLPFAARHGREATGNELRSLMWLSLLEQYLALCDLGIQFLALRYEDIVAHPQEVLAAIFAHCGLTADLDRAYAVFGRDSQAGTDWSRTSRSERPNFPLEEADYAQMRAVFAENAGDQAAGFHRAQYAQIRLNRRCSNRC